MKHVTVNADQALVTDIVVTDKPAGNVVPSPVLLTDATDATDATDKPMPRLDEAGKPEPAGI